MVYYHIQVAVILVIKFELLTSNSSCRNIEGEPHRMRVLTYASARTGVVEILLICHTVISCLCDHRPAVQLLSISAWDLTK